MHGYRTLKSARRSSPSAERCSLYPPEPCRTSDCRRPHSVHVTECGRRQSDHLQRSGGYTELDRDRNRGRRACVLAVCSCVARIFVSAFSRCVSKRRLEWYSLPRHFPQVVTRQEEPLFCRALPMLQLCWPESRRQNHDFQCYRRLDSELPAGTCCWRSLLVDDQILHDQWSNHRAIIVCMLEQCLRITNDAASTREAPLTTQNRTVHSL